jgi:Uma2 family endonuclease
MTIDAKLMTADELFRLPDDGMRHELVRGELRTVPPGGMEQGAESGIFVYSLIHHVLTNELGTVFTNEPGFVLATDPDTVRSPDVAFIRRERIEQTGIPGGYYRGGAPDIAVEVIWLNDLYTEVDEKVAEWLEHGTLVVFVVNPRRKVVAVHRPKQPVTILGMEDTLTAEDVLPGWSLAVRTLFTRR